MAMTQNEREINHLANIIEREMSKINPWGVERDAQREACEIAAEKINRYLKQKRYRQRSRATRFLN